MKPITPEEFQTWLAAYGKASIENDPRASAGLFSEDAAYYETPFATPMVGREAIYQYWEQGARSLKDKTADSLSVITNWKLFPYFMSSREHLMKSRVSSMRLAGWGTM